MAFSKVFLVGISFSGKNQREMSPPSREEIESFALLIFPLQPL
jgi:hypothetical protein